MGLTSWLARQAVRRCSVLLVEMPGGWRTRVYAERCIVGRGWQLADSPAGADLMVVCGRLAADLEERVEAVWDQLPGPRARVSLEPDETQQGVRAAIEAALPRLRDTSAQREDALGRSVPSGMDHEGMDHEGMDHEGMEMAPNGIALAEGAEDRDGLEMDELHLALGPVLRHWPAGLEMTWTLHGDLVTQVEGQWLPSAATGFAASDCPLAALVADAVLDVLQLAGWAQQADRAMRVRDVAMGSLDLAGGAGLEREVQALAGATRRSRTLRWSLRGLGHVERGWLDEHRLPAWWAGDAYDRLLALLEGLQASTTAPPGPVPDTPLQHPDADHLARLCAGVEVAAARLVLASLALPLGSLDIAGSAVHA